MAHEERDISENTVRHLANEPSRAPKGIGQVERRTLQPNDVRNSPLRRNLTQSIMILVPLTLSFCIEVEFHRCPPLDWEELDAPVAHDR